MDQTESSRLHDAYAAEYDSQVISYGCHLADVLFGLCYEYTHPGQRLLDAGTGTGLLAVLFNRVGLVVDGFDFSPAMLEICAAKGITASLKLHDMLQAPWPYPSAAYHHLTCCGVLHFLPEIEVVFQEASRVLREGGHFAFTTLTLEDALAGQGFSRKESGGFDIFAHTQGYIDLLLAHNGFKRLKLQKCIGGGEIFDSWAARKISPPMIVQNWE
jgi:predicted TPR repeat methyltransferase